MRGDPSSVLRQCSAKRNRLARLTRGAQCKVREKGGLSDLSATRELGPFAFSRPRALTSATASEHTKLRDKEQRQRKSQLSFFTRTPKRHFLSHKRERLVLLTAAATAAYQDPRVWGKLEERAASESVMKALIIISSSSGQQVLLLQPSHP